MERKMKTPTQISGGSATETAIKPRLDLLLLGPPGTGKGTQAGILSREFGLPHIATGDLFRENLKNQTDLGRLAQAYMDKGQLVPDDVTADMVRKRLLQPDVDRGFLLDGFPRTLPQAKMLEEMMDHLDRRIRGVIHIHLDAEEIVRRVSQRVICRQCQAPYSLDFSPPKQAGVCDQCGGEIYQRDDDKPQTVRARLKVYRDQTAPVVEHYRRTGLMKQIDAILGRDKVSETGKEYIRSLAKKLGLA